MSRSYISKALRAKVQAQARYRCGYCLTQQAVVSMPMELDHLIPEALGGRTVEENLWLSCSLCNDAKNCRIAARDPMSGEIVRLFNPREQAWSDHFRWSATCDLILGSTPTGRATVIALNLNRPTLVRARRAWVDAGWHPPSD
jgi:5-methylcytosine-specific restriction endonuclease McrA